MRRAYQGLRGVLLSLAALTGLSCSDSLPTENVSEPEPVRFELSEASARAFNDALDDVRDRVLPGLTTGDGPNALTSLLQELSGALAARDQALLRTALQRTEASLVQFDAADDVAAAIATDLDAVRFILEHARPLAYGQSSTAKR